MAIPATSAPAKWSSNIDFVVDVIAMIDPVDLVASCDCHGRRLRKPQNAKNKAPERYQGFLKHRQRRAYQLLMMVMSSSTHTAKHIPLTIAVRPVPRSHPLLRACYHNRVYMKSIRMDLRKLFVPLWQQFSRRKETRKKAHPLVKLHHVSFDPF